MNWISYTKNLDLRQWRREDGFKGFAVFIKFWITKHLLIFTVYFPHQTGIIIHISIPKLDRFSAKQKLLVILFLPQTIREWNKLDTSICQALSCSVYCKVLLDFIWPTANNSNFGTNDVSGLKLLTCLMTVTCLNLNIISKIHWTHCTLVPLKQKTPISFMHCQNCSNQLSVLFDDLDSINAEILNLSENEIMKSYYLGINVFLKIWILGLWHPQFVSLKTIKDLMNHFLNTFSWE